MTIHDPRSAPYPIALFRMLSSLSPVVLTTLPKTIHDSRSTTHRASLLCAATSFFRTVLNTLQNTIHHSQFTIHLTALLSAALLLPTSLRAQDPAADYNPRILAAITAMPRGGDYRTSKASFDGLRRSITVNGSLLAIQPEAAQPSFCSGATYLVFVRVLNDLASERALSLDPALLSSLLVSGQRDGQGVWGRWNANGPGTARLFSELQLGPNFQDFAAARPGDFMKIFWTSEIGKKERGHSVVYLGTNKVGTQEFVRFWSSNLPTNVGDLAGYGVKLVNKSKMARVIFSRLEHPANIARARTLGVDPFLASLLTRSAQMDEVKKMCDL